MVFGLAGLLTLGVICTPTTPPASHVGPVDDREALYRQGITFETFLDAAVRRRTMWTTNYAKGTVPQDLLDRGNAVPGTWRLLVVAVDSCSDSANTVPYLAHLVTVLPNLEMRIIDSDVGRTVMEDHRTPDGRAATPTMVLLNEDYEEVGCFVERPAALQTWALENRAKLNDDEFLKQKFAWYDNDLGRQTMDAIVTLMEKAAAGAVGC